MSTTLPVTGKWWRWQTVCFAGDTHRHLMAGENNKQASCLTCNCCQRCVVCCLSCDIMYQQHGLYCHMTHTPQSGQEQQLVSGTFNSATCLCCLCVNRNEAGNNATHTYEYKWLLLQAFTSVIHMRGSITSPIEIWEDDHYNNLFLYGFAFRIAQAGGHVFRNVTVAGGVGVCISRLYPNLILCSDCLRITLWFWIWIIQRFHVKVANRLPQHFLGHETG
jgi:hypothetical protein